MLRIFFYISVCVSGLVTAAAFWTANQYIVVFDPQWELYGGGNGNPGPFMFVVFLPSIIYFLFSLIILFDSLYASLSRRLSSILTIVMLIAAGCIFTRMLLEAGKWRDYINEHHPYMKVGLFSQFSNDLYFNGWTFSGLVFVMGVLGFLYARVK
ncbi:hypothetical protein KZX50_17000 [Bacillus infantis]|uniref:hypothetical protein n=1 Tax=Bacillus infantis TaxID=324767 RepID=UPI002004EC85|nr:hypothetical protein [Bacillus infantis]MCK6207138.1 hypothetical protein [Bacillus infantis]